MHHMPAQFLTTEQVAERYGLRVEQVQALRRCGRLKGLNVATGPQRKIWRYSESSLKEFEQNAAAA